MKTSDEGRNFFMFSGEEIIWLLINTTGRRNQELKTNRNWERMCFYPLVTGGLSNTVPADNHQTTQAYQSNHVSYYHKVWQVCYWKGLWSTYMIYNTLYDPTLIWHISDHRCRVISSGVAHQGRSENYGKIANFHLQKRIISNIFKLSETDASKMFINQ